MGFYSTKSRNRLKILVKDTQKWHEIKRMNKQEITSENTLIKEKLREIFKKKLGFYEKFLAI